MIHYISIQEIAKKLEVSLATAWRYVKKEGFPPSFKLSQGCTRWAEPEVDTWVQSRIVR